MKATTTTVTTAELPALLAAGPVTLRMEDPEDPCGGRVIARPLKAAYQHEDPHGRDDAVRGIRSQDRWMLAFGGSYLHLGHLLLPTSADARHELTDAAPEDPGPCEDCRSRAIEMWNE